MGWRGIGLEGLNEGATDGDREGRRRGRRGSADLESAARRAALPLPLGADDRRGAMNLMTPERAKAAAGLICTGEIVELGHVLATGIPQQARGNSTST